MQQPTRDQGCGDDDDVGLTHKPGPRPLSNLATRLWVVVSLFTLSTLQAISWNIFSPIFGTVTEVYQWSADEVEWLENGANVAMCVSHYLSSFRLRALFAVVRTAVILDVDQPGLTISCSPVASLFIPRKQVICTAVFNGARRLVGQPRSYLVLCRLDGYVHWSASSATYRSKIVKPRNARRRHLQHQHDCNGLQWAVGVLDVVCRSRPE